MNAHDRLRLYLEQRRELGESELVLDGLPVEAVLKLIGAPGGKGEARAASPSNTRAQADASRAAPVDIDSGAEPPPDVAPATPVAPPSDPVPRFDSNATVDWRAALRNLAPGSEQKSQPVDRVAEPTAPAASSTSERVPAANVASSFAPASPPPLVASFADFPSWIANLGIPAGLSATAPGDSSTSPQANAANTLDELASVIAACRACSLGASALNPVPGEGNPNADFVCVGEAPGQTEDETGRPFIGAAGELLTKILGAIQLPREEVFICNVLKHRPPGNRNPQPDEIHACTPYLTRQLSLVKPKVILALGAFAAQTLLNTTTSLGKLRGQVHRYQGIPLIVTYHPAALLRNEQWKRPTWDDVKLARRILDAARANASDNASSAS